jgi:glucose/mannose-6-phosphate isomerase
MSAGSPGERGPLDLDPLDDEARRAALDPSDMARAIGTLGDQLRTAADRLATIALPAPTSPWGSVAILGMGGSAMGADLLRAAFADRARLPIVVSREPELPAWVDASTLVIASSHSGRTAETLAATRTALERGASVLAVTSGGELAELAGTVGVIGIPPGGQPRAALGSSTGLLLAALAAAGVVDTDVARAELLAAAGACDFGTARYGVTVLAAANPAKQLARSLESRIGVVVAGGHLAPVARRWKNQLNENAKTWAVWDELPELAHNTIVGFDAPPDLRWAIHFVVLRGSESGDASARRRAVVGELEASGTAHTEIGLDPDLPLAEAFAGVILGDWVSYHLAMALGRDTTPIDAILRYKGRLSAS